MSDMSDSTKLVVEKLDELIQGAGALGEKSWPYLVREAVIRGWTLLISAIIGLILTLTLTGAWIHMGNDIGSSFSDWQMPVGAAALSMGTMTLCCLFGLIFEGIPAILNPQYRAIQDLFSLIRGEE